MSVGVVETTGGRIKDIQGNYIKEGDVVTFLDVHETCNNCYQCLVARQPTRCPSRKVYGITYSAKDGLLGGWAEAIWMKPGVKMIKLPKELSPETFIGGGCGLVTAIHAVDMAELKLGESVAVLGVGPVGQSIVAFSSLSGAGEIIAVGAPRERLDFARRMGATATLGLDLPAELAARDGARPHRRTRRRLRDRSERRPGRDQAGPRHGARRRPHDRLRALHGQRLGRDPPALAAQPKARRAQGLLGLAIRSLPSRRRAHGALRTSEAVGGDGQRAVSADEADQALVAVEKQTALKALITPNPNLTASGKAEAGSPGTR